MTKDFEITDLDNLTIIDDSELDFTLSKHGTKINVMDKLCKSVSKLLSCKYKEHLLPVVDYIYLSMLYVLKHWNDRCITTIESDGYKKLCKELDFILSELKFYDIQLMAIASCIPDIENSLKTLNAPIAIQVQFIHNNSIYNYQLIKDIFEKTIIIDTKTIFKTQGLSPPIRINESHKRKASEMINNAEIASSKKNRLVKCC